MSNPKSMHPLAALGTGAGLSSTRGPVREVSPDLQSLILRRIADPRATARELLSLADLAEREGAAQTAQALRTRAAQKGAPALPAPAPALPPAPPAAGLASAASLGDDAELAMPRVQPRQAHTPRTPGLAFRPRPTQGPFARAGGAPMQEPQETPPQTASAPISGVPMPAWIAFEKLMARGKALDVTAAGRLGMFGLSPKRLQDLGLVKEVRKVTVATPETRELLAKAKDAGPNEAAELRSKANMAAKRRWDAATWAEGITQDKFLGDPNLQVRAFRKSMREYAKAILELYKGAIGKQVGGKLVTLSGLLAVAHICGAPGLDSWIKKSEIREQFPQTTRAFMTATGLF